MGFAFFLLYLWFFRGDSGKKASLFAVLIGVIALGMNVLIAQIYFEPRPFTVLEANLLYPHDADASFPSDHTTGAFALAWGIFLQRKHFPRISFWMLLLAAATGFSRIYVGHHYPGDVLGSILVSLLIALLVYRFHKRLAPFARFLIEAYKIVVRSAIGYFKTKSPTPK